VDYARSGNSFTLIEMQNVTFPPGLKEWILTERFGKEKRAIDELFSY